MRRPVKVISLFSVAVPVAVRGTRALFAVQAVGPLTEAQGRDAGRVAVVVFCSRARIGAGGGMISDELLCDRGRKGVRSLSVDIEIIDLNRECNIILFC